MNGPAKTRSSSIYRSGDCLWSKFEPDLCATSGSGQSQPNWAIPATSGLLPIATELRTRLEVRFEQSSMTAGEHLLEHVAERNK
jgi:hypothetical protein